MTTEDIRWQQRFSNYIKALDKLIEAVEYVNNAIDNNSDSVLDEILKEGLIQRFEYTHELAWNVMKDFLYEVGGIKIIGSKDATREALSAELIHDGDLWMGMINSRNQTSHSYNEKIANEIYIKIINDYYPAFLAFRDTIEIKK